MKFGKKSAGASKKNLIVNLYVMKNISEKKFMRKKSTQIFTTIKYRKNFLNVFVYQ